MLITNQSGVGRGHFGWSDYDRVAARLRELLAAEGVVLDAECACGHAPAEGAGCGWRKPAPGMLQEAARLLDLDLRGSLMVGDMASDLKRPKRPGSAVPFMCSPATAGRSVATGRPGDCPSRST